MVNSHLWLKLKYVKGFGVWQFNPANDTATACRVLGEGLCSLRSKTSFALAVYTLWMGEMCFAPHKKPWNESCKHQQKVCVPWFQSGAIFCPFAVITCV